MELISTINGFDILMLALGFLGGLLTAIKPPKNRKNSNFKYYGK